MKETGEADEKKTLVENTDIFDRLVIGVVVHYPVYVLVFNSVECCLCFRLRRPIIQFCFVLCPCVCVFVHIFMMNASFLCGFFFSLVFIEPLVNETTLIDDRTRQELVILRKEDK